MNLLISTNMYHAGELKKVLKFITPKQEGLGVEVFPLFDHAEYEKELTACLPEFSKVPVSFHGPYYKAEHSAKKGTEPYRFTMEMVEKTLKYCKELHSSYMVFHHNNCRVDEAKKRDMIETACENFREIEKMYAPYNIPVLVENAGVMDRGNMLLDQDEFISLCKKERYQVLIDIGHAHANGWNLSAVMEELKGQIAAYHIHNNDGVHDSHQRIHNGTLDFDKFIEDYRKFTPAADIVLEYSPEVSSDESGIQEDIDYLMAAFQHTEE